MEQFNFLDNRHSTLDSTEKNNREAIEEKILNVSNNLR